MTKKARIPEGLRKLFSNRARTFAETILSLIPPPSSATVQLRCTGSQPCLHCCSHGDRMSFLLREDDPSGYCKLLNQCFVVASDIAASPPYSHHHSRWSQLEVSLSHTHAANFWRKEVQFCLYTKMKNRGKLEIIVDLWNEICIRLLEKENSVLYMKWSLLHLLESTNSITIECYNLLLTHSLI